MFKNLIIASMLLVVSLAFASEEAPQLSDSQTQDSSQFKELESTENTVKLQIDFAKGIQRSFASQGMYILYAQAKIAKAHGKPYSVMLWRKHISPQSVEIRIAFSETKKISLMQRAKFKLYSHPESLYMNVEDPLVVMDTEVVLDSLSKVFESNENQVTEQDNT